MAQSLDSLTGHAPGFDEPLAMLDACHGRVGAQCDTLERLVPHLAAHGADAPAREAAAAVIRFFDLAGENHHRDEEEDLFPALRERAAQQSLQVETLLAALLVDHGRMRQLWRNTLRPQLIAVNGGEVALRSETVQEFVELYRAHIRREDEELLPLVRQLLDAAVLRDIGECMAGRRGLPGAGKASNAQ